MCKDGRGAPDITGVSVGIMKKLRLATLVAGLAAAASFLQVAPAQAQALGGGSSQTVDTIAAVVNNGVITQRELDQRVGMIARQMSDAFRGGEQCHERELSEQVEHAYRRLVADWQPKPPRSGAGATRGRAFSSHLLGEETAARQGTAPEPAL